MTLVSFNPLNIVVDPEYLSLGRYDNDTLMEDPKRIKVILRGRNVRMVIANTEQAVSKLSTFMNSIGRVGIHEIFVFTEDTNLQDGAVSALKSVPLWAPLFRSAINPPGGGQSEAEPFELDVGLRVTKPRAQSALFTRSAPAGDFQATVDFEALQFPAPKRKRNRNEFSLAVEINQVSYRIARWKDSGGDAYVFQDFGGGSNLVISRPNVVDIAGRLRLRRVSGTVCGDFSNGQNWMNVGCSEGAFGTGFVSLDIFSGGGDFLKVRFRKFRLEDTGQ